MANRGVRYASAMYRTCLSEHRYAKISRAQRLPFVLSGETESKQGGRLCWMHATHHTDKHDGHETRLSASNSSSVIKSQDSKYFIWLWVHTGCIGLGKNKAVIPYVY